MDGELRIIWLLALGLGLACILGYIAQKAKQSPIIGYLLAGYILGPNSPGIVVDTYISEQLASIGVTLLMFVVGLSFNWKDLIAVRKIALPGALILSTLCILAGTLYGQYLGEPLISGFVIGLAVCVASTVVIVRVLSDRGLLHTPQGHIVVGWTIVEDLISVFGLLILPALAQPSMTSEKQVLNVIYPVILVFVKVAIFGFFVYYFGERIIDKILKITARTRSHELFTLAVLAIAFLIALGSSYLFGVSLALGAFIAGTIVGKTDLSHQAAANAFPMRDVFAVIFFLSVGMLFSPLAVTNNLALFFGVLFILLIFRPVIAFFLVKMAKYPKTVALTVALSLAQIGEYSFILAEEGSRLQILPNHAYDIVVASSFISIVLNSILFHIFSPLIGKKMQISEQDREFSVDLLHGTEVSSLPLAVVIGFGPVGQDTSKYLLKKGYRVIIIDQNIDTVSSKKDKIEIIFGDAAQFHILEKGQIENAELLIVTTPEFNITKSIIQTARNINPFIKIVARSRFKDDLKNANLEDVVTICDEEATSEQFIAAIEDL